MLHRFLRQSLAPDGGGLTDGQLLGRFIARRDEAAFAALVRRHGPMVFGVCRRVLRHAQDAEDAFQAAFVVLARKAASLADREAVAGWLYGTAYRAALEARAAGARRRARERQVEAMPHPEVWPDEGGRELLGLLDRELSRLPEKYRLPVVLCELEGRSRKEAARQLGLPEGTLSSRLAAARKALARRLAGCGLAVTGVALAALWAGEARAAGLPASLVVSTVRAAGGAVPAGIAALTQGVLKAMLLSKLKAAAWGLLLAASVTVAGVGLTCRTAAAQPGRAADLVPTAVAPASDKDDLESLRREVQALREDLQAVRDRVKALEAEKRASKGEAGTNPPAGGGGYPIKASDGSAQPKGPGTRALPDGAALPKGADNVPGVETGRPSGAVPGPGEFGGPGSAGFTPGSPGPKGAAPPGAGLPGGDASDPAAAVDAALQKLRLEPDNKQALEALERAVQRLKEQAKPGAGERAK
jgi:RNA polymerase sigma factor (sigma-70 family)